MLQHLLGIQLGTVHPLAESHFRNGRINIAGVNQQIIACCTIWSYLSLRHLEPEDIQQELLPARAAVMAPGWLQSVQQVLVQR